MATKTRVLDLMKKMDESNVPKEKQALYLGQFKKETGNFKTLEEGLRYTTLKQLRKMFSVFRTMPDEKAREYLNNPKKLANFVYDDANRSASRKLGNTEEGDGWKYRGRGYIQVTGRENYKKLSKQLFGDENVLLDDPDILSDPEFGADASIAWLNSKTKNMTTSDEISEVVNKGEGAADRKKYSDAFAKQLTLNNSGVKVTIDGDAPVGGQTDKEWNKYKSAVPSTRLTPQQMEQAVKPTAQFDSMKDLLRSIGEKVSSVIPSAQAGELDTEAAKKENLAKMAELGLPASNWGMVAQMAKMYQDYQKGKQLDAMGEAVSPPLAELPQRMSFEEQQAMSNLMSGVGSDYIPPQSYDSIPKFNYSVGGGSSIPKVDYRSESEPQYYSLPSEPQYMSMEDLLMDKGLIQNPLLFDDKTAEQMWRQF